MFAFNLSFFSTHHYTPTIFFLLPLDQLFYSQKQIFFDLLFSFEELSRDILICCTLLGHTKPFLPFLLLVLFKLVRINLAVVVSILIYK